MSRLTSTPITRWRRPVPRNFGKICLCSHFSISSGCYPPSCCARVYFVSCLCVALHYYYSLRIERSQRTKRGAGNRRRVCHETRWMSSRRRSRQQPFILVKRVCTLQPSSSSSFHLLHPPSHLPPFGPFPPTQTATDIYRPKNIQKSTEIRVQQLK